MEITSIFGAVDNTFCSFTVAITIAIIFIYVIMENTQNSQQAQLAPKKKASAPLVVVADIDHTIKQRNTLFLTPPVEGMLELFEKLGEKCETKIEFHYLTNRYGPFGSLSRKWCPSHFLSTCAFPQAHNLHARAASDFYGYVSRNPGHKKSTLSGLLPLDFLSKKDGTPASVQPALLLLGDSTENDALVYCDFCSRKEHHHVSVVIGIRLVPPPAAATSDCNPTSKQEKKFAETVKKLEGLKVSLRASGNTAAEMIMFREVSELREVLLGHHRWCEVLV